jgi:two-component sensor histidine kinase
MRCIDESFYQLSIWDDGVGLPANVNHRMTTSLGLQLVNSLTRQLGGTVEVQTDPGTKFTICFPKVVAHQPARVENAQ